MMDWISVKDELPKDKQDVIIYDGAVMCLTYFEEQGDRRCKKPKGVFVNLNEDFEKVTHWIPVELPPLPKGE